MGMRKMLLKNLNDQRRRDKTLCATFKTLSKLVGKIAGDLVQLYHQSANEDIKGVIFISHSV